MCKGRPYRGLSKYTSHRALLRPSRLLSMQDRLITPSAPSFGRVCVLLVHLTAWYYLWHGNARRLLTIKGERALLETWSVLSRRVSEDVSKFRKWGRDEERVRKFSREWLSGDAENHRSYSYTASY